MKIIASERSWRISGCCINRTLAYTCLPPAISTVVATSDNGFSLISLLSLDWGLPSDSPSTTGAVHNARESCTRGCHENREPSFPWSARYGCNCHEMKNTRNFNKQTTSGFVLWELFNNCIEVNYCVSFWAIISVSNTILFNEKLDLSRCNLEERK